MANSSTCCSTAMSSRIAPWWAAASSGSSCRGAVLEEAEILSVAVAASRRGKGLARQLLDLHLRRLAGLGARAVFLEVDEGNAAGAPALSARRLP